MAGNRKLGELLVKKQPWLLKNGETWLWRPLRAVKPVLRVKNLVILTRHEDVRRVLEADDRFSVTYGEHMEAVTGPFILGMDDGPRYRRESRALHSAAPHSDLPFVAELTRERASRHLGSSSSLDAVELADAVTGAGIDRYFGLPGCATPAALAGGRDVFRAVFLDGDVPEVMERGQAEAHKLTADMRRAMAEIRSHGGREETVLGRLLAAQGTDAPQLDDEGIPRSLLGLQAAWAASVPRAFSLALDVVLDRPAELARLRALAAAGEERRVGELLVEALRLQPQAPFLTRLARSEMVVAPGARREHRIKPGDIVFAVTQAAQHDRTVLDAPGALKEGRPPTDVLHFGAGIHRCFGAAISVTQFGVLGTLLLRDGSLERDGALRWGPAFPQALPLRRT